MKQVRILVVDDDRNLLELLAMRLEAAGYDAVPASNAEDALSAASETAFDLAIIDLQLGKTDGISLMERLRQVIPDLPAIILTAYGTIESAVEAIKKGAFTYLTKPFAPQELILQTERALENRRLTSELRRLKGIVEERYSFDGIVARSEKMQLVLEKVSLIARTDSTVYVQGESGTGKELIAKAVHTASPRKDGPFVAINCAAIPENLLESELFGHEKGAFTGALATTRGLFSQADKGSLFLDEIGDMPLSLQAKLLRVLQDKQFYPLGAKKPMAVDVRIIVATNKDLEAEVKKGAFREDLFYRIHVIPIYLPPLRERKEDIPPLVQHFTEKLARQMKKEIRGFSPEAMQKLMLHDWPGNVRELENTIEYAAAMARQEIITEDLILQQRNLPPLENEVRPLKEAREDFEKGYLVRLLEFTSGNVSKAAELAGRYRADLYNLLKKYRIKPEDFKKS